MAVFIFGIIISIWVWNIVDANITGSISWRQGFAFASAFFVGILFSSIAYAIEGSKANFWHALFAFLLVSIGNFFFIPFYIFVSCRAYTNVKEMISQKILGSIVGWTCGIVTFFMFIMIWEVILDHMPKKTKKYISEVRKIFHPDDDSEYESGTF